MHRPDAMRPSCPAFKARTDYRGSSYIKCGGKNWRFTDSSTRESQYRACCCGNYAQCEIYRIIGGKDHDDAGNR